MFVAQLHCVLNVQLNVQLRDFENFNFEIILIMLFNFEIILIMLFNSEIILITFEMFWIKSIIFDKNANYQFIVLFLCNIAIANVQNKIYSIFDSNFLTKNENFWISQKFD